MSDLKKTAPAGDKPKGKGKGMGDAISGTEAIRTWDDHRIGKDALAKRFNTDT
jgi:hypothetical protein